MRERESMGAAGVILAGGLSRRMGGGDKALAPIDRRSMLDVVVSRVGSQVARLVLNANGDPARFAVFGLPVIADPIEGFVGPLAGVLAGLRWAGVEMPEMTHVLSVSSDAPFLPDDLVTRLAAALASHPDARIALAGSGGRVHPVIGLWPVALAEDLDAALRSGQRKVRDWADRHGAVVVNFPMHATAAGPVDPFFNANTPEELDEVRRILPLLAP